MGDYQRHRDEDARCRILMSIAQERDRRLSDRMLVHSLEAWGFNGSVGWMRTQLLQLEELGAVTLVKEPTFIATLTEAGDNHVRRKVFVHGIRQPEPWE